MKPKEYRLMERCVEEGVLHGWNRAHKHTDLPEPHYIRECIETDVVGQLCEWFDLEDENPCEP